MKHKMLLIFMLLIGGCSTSVVNQKEPMTHYRRLEWCADTEAMGIAWLEGTCLSNTGDHLSQYSKQAACEVLAHYRTECNGVTFP